MILWIANNWLLFLLLWPGGLAAGMAFTVVGGLRNSPMQLAAATACFLMAAASWLLLVASFIVNLAIFIKG